jgi:hypothetical protein
MMRTLTFFARRSKPRWEGAIDLCLAPVQYATAHNGIIIDLKQKWSGGEDKLARYLPSSVPPNFPDYAKVFDTSQEDPDRLKEFRRSYTPQEFLEMLAERDKMPPQAPFGPYGFIEDIYWFNYFGTVHTDFIGRARLEKAGWARVEEIGGGLACYATETIDDPDLLDRCAWIRDALVEFVWTPGCKPEEKKAPGFDFSEQFAAAPQRAAPSFPPGTRHITFEGFSDEEKRQAIEAWEQTGMVYDEETGMLLRSKKE